MTLPRDRFELTARCKPPGSWGEVHRFRTYADALAYAGRFDNPSGPPVWDVEIRDKAKDYQDSLVYSAG